MAKQQGKFANTTLNSSWNYATEDEKKYLWLVKKRIEEGNLSELIRESVLKRAQKTSFHQAIIDVYSTLIKCLMDNQPYSLKKGEK